MNEGVMLDNSYCNVPPFPSDDDDVFSLQSNSLNSYAHEHDDDESNSCGAFSKKCN